MPLFSNCLLASDVDGTLVDAGYISPRNIEAIKFFRKNGGTFVLSTGRSSSALGQVFALMDKALVGPCVVLNGGMIYDFGKDKPLYARELTYSSKEYVKTVKEKLPNVGIEVHSNSYIYVINKTEETEFHEDYERLDREYVTFENTKNKPWNKILYTCDDDNTREKLIKTLTALDNNECFFVKTEVSIDGVHHLYLEQLPFGTTKASALKELCKMLDIKKGGLFAIGDYFNDVEMLSMADIASTPCESPQEIKKLANFVGGRCRDGAVADFLEYLTSNWR